MTEDEVKESREYFAARRQYSQAEVEAAVAAAVAAERERRCRREKQVFNLWRMLDDIDTLDDACRENDASFRALVRDIQRKRFDVLPGHEFESLWRVYGPDR